MHVLINHPPLFTYLYHAMMQVNSLVLGFVHGGPEKRVILPLVERSNKGEHTRDCTSSFRQNLTK